MIGIIGGTGLSEPSFLNSVQTRQIITPFDEKPVQIVTGTLHGTDVSFLPRHGKGHKVPPHRINYRANIWALHSIGVRALIGVNAVGGIHPETGPGRLAVPEQIIDYTWGREHTFFADGLDTVTHIDFTHPYDETLRQLLIHSAGDLRLWPEGVYACTQGPRLETAAEVERLRRDGADMIGMTGLPEAALAREIGIAYACIALSVNWAAGLSDDIITMEAIGEVLQGGMGSVLMMIERAVQQYASDY
ncbi:MAG: S-methyl-5'-thioinosine phosphorylase [Gammaproteobacteria bacterium]|nr:S-methyl-5'-thioinosine phosphorylase [Gammaproteobacteria bacterium]